VSESTAATHDDIQGLRAGASVDYPQVIDMVSDLTPLAAHISDAYAENRPRPILLAFFFSLTAIALACGGLYGTLSYLVNHAGADRAAVRAAGAA
jgi:hypothetical protein